MEFACCGEKEAWEEEEKKTRFQCLSVLRWWSRRCLCVLHLSGVHLSDSCVFATYSVGGSEQWQSRLGFRALWWAGGGRWSEQQQQQQQLSFIPSFPFNFCPSTLKKMWASVFTKKTKKTRILLHLCIWLTSHSFISRKVHSHKSKVTLLYCPGFSDLHKYCTFSCLHTAMRIDVNDTCMQQTHRAGECCHEMVSSVVQVTFKMHYIAYYRLPSF